MQFVLLAPCWGKFLLYWRILFSPPLQEVNVYSTSAIFHFLFLCGWMCTMSLILMILQDWASGWAWSVNLKDCLGFSHHLLLCCSNGGFLLDALIVVDICYLYGEPRIISRCYHFVRPYVGSISAF